MILSKTFLNAMVFNLLDNAYQFPWSLQGFGMLRLPLPGGCRLNIWDSRYRVENVSLMHTHPWHFDSLIVSGHLRNTRYVERPYENGTVTCSRGLIQPGPGGGKLRDSGTVLLQPCAVEHYWPGETYCQRAEEIHISDPEDGTITLNYRQRVGPDTAQVFWPKGTNWVSAEPRTATPDEVSDIVGRAMNSFKSVAA